MANDDGITHIFMELRNKLGRAVLGIVPPKEVEDIVQETYVRACQVSNKAKIQEPKAFLFTVARNLALDFVKRADTRLSVSIENADELEAMDSTRFVDETLNNVASREEFTMFCEAVRKLPAQRRRAFVLKKVYGYTQREIAAEMQLSEKTVERHIALGMEDCMKYFQLTGDANTYAGVPKKPGGARHGSSKAGWR